MDQTKEFVAGFDEEKEKLLELQGKTDNIWIFYTEHLFLASSGPGPGRVKVRRVRFGPELYPIFGFHHHPPHKLFFPFKWV